MNQHYLQSSYREKLIEHLFIGELLKHSWRKRKCALEIAQPEVDNSGYDLMAEDGRVTRHIQLKTTRRGAKAADQKIHIALGKKPSGCLVWIFFDDETLELGPFLIFGGKAGKRLPSLNKFKIGRHTKPNSAGVKTERKNIRVVPKARFRKYEKLTDLYAVLFQA